MSIAENIISFAASNGQGRFNRRVLCANFGSGVNLALYRLLKEKKIVRTGRGEYTLNTSTKVPFTIAPDEYMKSLSERISGEFPFTQNCIWNPDVMIPYMRHVPNLKMYIVEIERLAMDALFSKLESPDSKRRVLVNPTASEYARYASGYPCLIIKPIVTQAPLVQVQGVAMPSLEKILVDLTCGRPELAFASGSEMYTIYENAFEKHEVNVKTMMRYARRRGKAESVQNLIDYSVHDTGK